MASFPLFFPLAISAGATNAAIASAAVAVAAAVLSVFVVLRNWSYMGEGISHAGFGGIGTALLLSIRFPSLNNGPMIYLVGSSFCVLTAVAIAWISRRRAISGDAAIGIFVAATLAWGFIAFSIHKQMSRGGTSGWEDYLLGNIDQVSPAATFLAVGISVAIVLVALALYRQIVMYCFDPTLAEVTGVPVGFIHYLLTLLVALVIIVGMRLTGNLLVPAFLVLPGAAGLAVSRKMAVVMSVSIGCSIIATFLGLLVARKWSFIAPGPATVGILFFEFLIVHLANLRRESEGS